MSDESYVYKNALKAASQDLKDIIGSQARAEIPHAGPRTVS
jgi:hypothetical protein